MRCSVQAPMRAGFEASSRKSHIRAIRSHPSTSMGANSTGENDQTRVADLENTVTELRHTIEVMQENKRLTEQVTHLGDETIRLSYQQAADWVRMSNLVTWSLGSIYVVAAVIALNGAVQQQNEVWRTLIGGVVIFLAVAWALIDFAYLCSIRSARRYLISIENQWPDRQPLPRGFLSGNSDTDICSRWLRHCCTPLHWCLPVLRW